MKSVNKGVKKGEVKGWGKNAKIKSVNKGVKKGRSERVGVKMQK